MTVCIAQSSIHSPLPIKAPQEVASFQKKINDLWASISLGAFVGTCELVFELVFIGGGCALIPHLEECLADPALAAEYLEESNFLEDVVVAPIVEEIIFRVVIQNVFHWAAKRLLPDQDVKVFSIQFKLATLVAIVATSILFGALHLSSGLGILHFISATMGGIVYGLLKEKYGLATCISADMTNNAIVFGAEALGV